MRGAAGLGAEARSPGINGVGADGVIAEIINKCGSWYFESIYFLVLSFFFFFFFGNPTAAARRRLPSYLLYNTTESWHWLQ